MLPVAFDFILPLSFWDHVDFRSVLLMLTHIMLQRD